MRMNFSFQSKNKTPVAEPKPAPLPPKILRFKREDFEKTIVCLPREKQELARGLFSSEPGSRSRFMTADETRLRAFVQQLAPEEKKLLTDIAGMDGMFMRPESTFPKKPVPKDSGRFTPVPAPEARPAKGEDLHTPIGSHAASPKDGAQENRPSSKTQDRPPAPSGSAQGKPNTESAKPKHATLADLLAAESAEEKAGRNAPIPPQTGTQGRPGRVRFAEEASVRKYPVGEDFQPGEFQSGSPHTVSFDRKDKPGRYRPAANSGTAQGPSTSGSTRPKRKPQGQESPYPLDNPAYPPPPPPKGPLKKPTQAQEGQVNAPAKMSTTKKVVLGSAAALAAVTMLGIASEDTPSSAPAET